MVHRMNIWGLLRKTASAWMADRAMSMSAALAYYAVFSLAPLLIVAISIAGAIFGGEAARGAIKEQLEGSIGPEAARAVQEMIEGASQSGDSKMMALLGCGLLLVTASGVFKELKSALNIIWETEAPKGNGILYFLKDRGLSLAMVLVIGFLLLVSLLLSAALAASTTWLERVLVVPPVIWLLLNFFVSLGVITVLFAMIFKILPDTHVRWRDVWTGALLTSALFSIGKVALALYLGQSGAATTYGAAGALVLILSWVYYSANILLFGAEFTKVFAKSRG